MADALHCRAAARASALRLEPLVRSLHRGCLLRSAAYICRSAHLQSLQKAKYIRHCQGYAKSEKKRCTFVTQASNENRDADLQTSSPEQGQRKDQGVVRVAEKDGSQESEMKAEPAKVRRPISAEERERRTRMEDELKDARTWFDYLVPRQLRR